MSPAAGLHALGTRLVGRWTTEATHPSLPGTLVPGTSDVEWLEGEQFLVIRSHADHPDFPDSISVVGDTGDTAALQMHYFDSRGVHRLVDVTVTDTGWATSMGRDAPEGSFATTTDGPFAQRITFTFGEDDQTIVGLCELSFDDVHWDDDLEITYRKR